VHALVRDDRLDAAFAVLDEMKSKDLVCPEVYLKLLRERCKVCVRLSCLASPLVIRTCVCACSLWGFGMMRSPNTRLHGSSPHKSNSSAKLVANA
jgi:pentatricopeptide repeat protein